MLIKISTGKQIPSKNEALNYCDRKAKQLKPFWAQIIGKVQQVIYVKENLIWNICN